MSDYIKEVWDYSADETGLNELIDLIKSKKSVTVIKHIDGDGVVLVGEDFESEEQSNKILEALNAPQI